MLQVLFGYHSPFGSILYCMLHEDVGYQSVSGNILYCVLQYSFGYHTPIGSTIVEVRQGVSPFHALTHDSYKHS
jgi:hypothetical protein